MGIHDTSFCCSASSLKTWLFSTALLCLALLYTSRGAQAAEWSTTNVQLLHGNGYELGDDSMSIMTFEHANGWKYGDNFFFLDVNNPAARGTGYYAEFAPRVSFGKLTGKSLKFGPIKDVLIAGTQEMGDELRATLLGIGFALDIPKFAFADINFYYRKSSRDWLTEQTDGGAQITLDWLLPFSIAGQKFAAEGFADYAWGEKGGSSPKADNWVAGPRLLIDVGNWVGAPGTLQVGIEYQIWRNKFGVDGVNEDVPQLMVKWTM